MNCPRQKLRCNGYLTYSGTDNTTVIVNGQLHPLLVEMPVLTDLLHRQNRQYASSAGQQPATSIHLRHKIIEPYVQDDWHATPKLTLNLGLRISIFTTSHDTKLQAFNFDPTKYVFKEPALLMRMAAWAAIPSTAWCNAAKVEFRPVAIPVTCLTPLRGLALHGILLAMAGPPCTEATASFSNTRMATKPPQPSFEGSAPLVQTPTQSNIVGYAKMRRRG